MTQVQHDCPGEDCRVCEFQREHPQETRVNLIFATSKIFSLLVEVEAACLNAQMITDEMSKSIGLNPEGLEEFMNFDNIVANHMVGGINNNPSMILIMHDMLEVCMALLPKDVVLHAQNVTAEGMLKVGQERGHVTDKELQHATEQLERVYKRIIDAGRDSLFGDGKPSSTVQ